MHARSLSALASICASVRNGTSIIVYPRASALLRPRLAGGDRLPSGSPELPWSDREAASRLLLAIFGHAPSRSQMLCHGHGRSRMIFRKIRRHLAGERKQLIEFDAKDGRRFFDPVLRRRGSSSARLWRCRLEIRQLLGERSKPISSSSLLARVAEPYVPCFIRATIRPSCLVLPTQLTTRYQRSVKYWRRQMVRMWPTYHNFRCKGRRPTHDATLERKQPGNKPTLCTKESEPKLSNSVNGTRLRCYEMPAIPRASCRAFGPTCRVRDREGGLEVGGRNARASRSRRKHRDRREPIFSQCCPISSEERLCFCNSRWKVGSKRVQEGQPSCYRVDFWHLNTTPA